MRQDNYGIAKEIQMNTAETKAPLPDDASKHMAELIRIAAHLVQGANMPSHYREDHKRHAPKWLLADIEKADENLRATGVKLKAARDGIRAHIAAQAAEIEELKSDNATLYKGQQDMCADIREKQAEIERLRGALQFYADGPYVETYKNGIRQDAVIMGDRGRRAQEALAPCKTCGGSGYLKIGGYVPDVCTDCYGTGRK